MPDENHKTPLKRKIQNVSSEEIPKITMNGIKHAVEKIKSNKTTGPDVIIAEMIK